MDPVRVSDDTAPTRIPVSGPRDPSRPRRIQRSGETSSPDENIYRAVPPWTSRVRGLFRQRVRSASWKLSLRSTLSTPFTRAMAVDQMEQALLAGERMIAEVRRRQAALLKGFEHALAPSA